MAFCGNCGTQVQDGVKFCPSCGNAVEAAPVGQTPPVQSQYQQQPSYGQATPTYQPPIVPGAPTQGDIRDAQAGKTMSILAYILFFIPLLTGAHKTSPFVKYHTNQGTVLFIFAAVYGVAYSVISGILLAISWRLWLIGNILGWVSLVFLVLCVVGIINAANGKMNPLPVIGGISIIK